MKIDFMNLSRQYNEHKEEFLDAIENVCESTAFSGGKFSEQFEKEWAEYVGVKYCVGVGSGTDAIFLVTKALGICEGDEVIVPADTFIASAWGAAYCNATPVFVDCDKDTWEIDVDAIETAITSNTKAIMAVHLYGQPCNLTKIVELAQKYGVCVIEDCAQAHGAKWNGRKVGTFGKAGCFSFYPGKNLGAFGEAGAITTNDRELYEKVLALRNHGAYERYYHDMIGYNMRLDGIQGAILSKKLMYLDGWNARRNEIAARYRDGIKNPRIKMQAIDDNAYSVFHLFEVEVDEKKQFLDYMAQNEISCGQHYPVPCHLQKAFGYLGYKEGDIPVAEEHAKKCISLPMFPELKDEEIDRVISVCNNWKV